MQVYGGGQSAPLEESVEAEMAKTFQEFASENLAGFGWTMNPSEIPEYATCVQAINEISAWWLSLDTRTQQIILDCDLAPGLWDAGLLTTWPSLYGLISGNTFGHYRDTQNNVTDCLERAANQVNEQGSTP